MGTGEENMSKIRFGLGLNIHSNPPNPQYPVPNPQNCYQPGVPEKLNQTKYEMVKPMAISATQIKRLSLVLT